MGRIVAVVTLSRDKVYGGGAPIFVADDDEDMQRVAFKLEKMLDAAALDIENGTMILMDSKDE